MDSGHQNPAAFPSHCVPRQNSRGRAIRAIRHPGDLRPGGREPDGEPTAVTPLVTRSGICPVSHASGRSVTPRGQDEPARWPALNQTEKSSAACRTTS